MVKSLSILIMMLLFIPLVYASVPTGCSFLANHYECDLTTQTSSVTFNSGIYGIEVTGIDLVGADGVSGANGEDVDILLTSSDKIIVNGVVSIIGGDGSRETQGDCLRASEGGDVSLVLNAPDVIINNSITLLSGSSPSATGSCYGRESGESLLDIISTNSVIIDKSIINITTGTIGRLSEGTPEDAIFRIDNGNVGTLLINMSKITITGGDRVNTSERFGSPVRLNIDMPGNVYDTNISLTPSVGYRAGDMWVDIRRSNLINCDILMTAVKGIEVTPLGDSYVSCDIDYSNITNSIINIVGTTTGTPSSGATSSFDTVYLKNSTFLASAGQGINEHDIGTMTVYLHGNNIFENSIVNASVTGATLFEIEDDSNTLYNKSTFNFIGTGSTVNYTGIGSTKTEFRESVFNCTSASTVCNFIFNSTEINFYNKTTIDLNSATNVFKIYADRALFWNFTEDQSAAQDSDFYVKSVSNSTIGLRGGNTFGAWTWNNSTINQTFDRYFLSPTTLGIIKKSTDVGAILYNSTNFTCTYNVDRSSENESGMYINISFLNNGAEAYSQTGIAYEPNIDYNSTIQVNGSNTDIEQNWSCSYNFYSTGFSYTNVSENKTISVAYPYNLKVYIGDNLLYSYDGEFTTSVLADMDTAYVNDYTQNYCDTTTCTIPLTFISEISSKINLSHLNISYGVSNPITNANNTVSVPFTVYSDAAGIVNVTDLEFVYTDRAANITIVATSLSGLSSNATIETVFSNFSVDINPKGINEWNIYPATPTDKSIPPFGNKYGDGNPFWNVTSLGTIPMDVYLMYNESLVSCATTWFQGHNVTSTNHTLSSTTPNLVFTNYTSGDALNVSTWTNLSCTWEEPIELPYFRFVGLCSECVRTTNWYNNNVVIE